jgi:hypothetical protein
MAGERMQMGGREDGQFTQSLGRNRKGLGKRKEGKVKR